MSGADETFEAFVAAFNALDLDALAATLAEDATLFAPAGAIGLVEGREAMRRFFAGVFAAEPPGGPRIVPVNRRTTPLGDDAALVNFEFACAGGSTGRRSLVFVRAGGAWRLRHIHASNMPPSGGPP